jgi:hypothetical protein
VAHRRHGPGCARGGGVSDPLTLALVVVLVICLAFVAYYLFWP